MFVYLLGVYTKNRNFRFFKSTKFGKNASLEISQENKYKVWFVFLSSMFFLPFVFFLFVSFHFNHWSFPSFSYFFLPSLCNYCTVPFLVPFPTITFVTAFFHPFLPSYSPIPSVFISNICPDNLPSLSPLPISVLSHLFSFWSFCSFSLH